MRRPLLRGLLSVTLAAAAAACGSETPLPNEPTPPPVVTETFSGTLTLNGAFTFPFTVSQQGSANLNITSLAPHTTLRVREGGTGNFIVGETVYVGENIDDAPVRSRVHGWDPALRRLLVVDTAGTFTADAVVVGEQSGASWTVDEALPVTVGIALGTWNGATCTLVLVNDNAFRNDFIAGVVQGAGNLCARVYDPGRLEYDVAFTIELNHF